MKRKRWGRKGFSLAEVMVASGLVTGMGLTLAVVLRTAVWSWQAGQNQVTTSSELRRGIHAIARELAQTRGDQLVGLPADGNSYASVQFSVPEDRDGNGTVLSAAGVLEWSANPITYSLGGVNGQELQRTQTGAPVTPLPVAYGVTVLSFRRRVAAPSVLEMNVTVQRGAANGAQPVTLSTRIRLRN